MATQWFGMDRGCRVLYNKTTTETAPVLAQVTGYDV